MNSRMVSSPAGVSQQSGSSSRKRQGSDARPQAITTDSSDASAELERRRRQNREAQRKYRSNIQQRFQELDEIKAALGMNGPSQSTAATSQGTAMRYNVARTPPTPLQQDVATTFGNLMDISTPNPAHSHQAAANGVTGDGVFQFHELYNGQGVSPATMSTFEMGDMLPFVKQDANPGRQQTPRRSSTDTESIHSGPDTPLHLAAAGSHVGAVRMLLDHGAPVDPTDMRGETPLHVAASSGHLEVVDCLLNSGAAPAARDVSGMTPLHRAAQNGHTEVVRRLVRSGANPNAVVSCAEDWLSTTQATCGGGG